MQKQLSVESDLLGKPILSWTWEKFFQFHAIGTDEPGLGLGIRSSKRFNPTLLSAAATLYLESPHVGAVADDEIHLGIAIPPVSDTPLRSLELEIVIAPRPRTIPLRQLLTHHSVRSTRRRMD